MNRADGEFLLRATCIEKNAWTECVGGADIGDRHRCKHLGVYADQCGPFEISSIPRPRAAGLGFNRGSKRRRYEWLPLIPALSVTGRA